MLSIGLMSGTSMDGIDAALLRTCGTPDSIEELGHCSFDYPAPFKILLKAAEFAVRKYQGNFYLAEMHYHQEVCHYVQQELKISDDDLLEHYQRLSVWLNQQNTATTELSLHKIIELSTNYHALAVRKLLSITGYSPEQIEVVGYHGQTLYHQPQHKLSINIGNGYALAQTLGITVVNDFRSRDIQAGGQGAPLAPLYHHALAVRDKKIPLAIVNCGGIANITLINSSNESDIIAFDTGPGNGLIDSLVRQRTGGREFMDAHAQYGLKGSIRGELFGPLYQRCLMKNGSNYFALPPPKSLDIGDMILIPELNSLTLEDACATLEAFTADCIIKSLEWIRQKIPQNWILCGGGWNNPVILRELKHRLQTALNTEVGIQKADAAGWNSQAMEAQIFAYLAVRSLQNLPLSLPGTTGIAAPITGGKIHIPVKNVIRTNATIGLC